MINHDYLKWEAPLNPPVERFEDEKQKFIEEKIIDFAKHLSAKRMENLTPENDELVDLLYEHIEENIEKFLPEATYDY